MRRRGAGFSLFEVLGVILITALLLGVVVNFYIDLSNQAARASEATREVRRAAALLDRIAADLEHTLLVRKPEDADPLAHPWLFLGENRYGGQGADQLKFVRRALPRSSEGPASDLAVVAYTLRRNEDVDAEGFELLRWSRPELPEGLDREWPLPEDPDALLVTDGIEYLGFRFLDDLGEWQEAWDSSQLLDSGELPLAVQIEVALVDARGEEEEQRFDELPRPYVRTVQLPVRPIDLEVLLDPEAAEGEGDGGEDGEDEYGDLTVRDCIDPNLSASDLAAAGFSATDIDTLSALAQNLDAPFAPYADILGGLPGLNPECR